MIQKTDQTLEKVVQLLNKKYRISRTEKVEEAVKEIMKFREDYYEEDDDLIMAMQELNQRRKDLKITFEEFISVWMLGKIKRIKKMESFEIQAFRDVVKAGGEKVIENLEEKFIEVQVEGKRKSPSSAMFTECLPVTHYTEKEHEEIEAMYMGKESLPRKRF